MNDEPQKPESGSSIWSWLKVILGIGAVTSVVGYFAGWFDGSKKDTNVPPPPAPDIDPYKELNASVGLDNSALKELFPEGKKPTAEQVTQMKAYLQQWRGNLQAIRKAGRETNIGSFTDRQFENLGDRMHSKAHIARFANAVTTYGGLEFNSLNEEDRPSKDPLAFSQQEAETAAVLRRLLMENNGAEFSKEVLHTHPHDGFVVRLSELDRMAGLSHGALNDKLIHETLLLSEAKRIKSTRVFDPLNDAFDKLHQDKKSKYDGGKSHIPMPLLSLGGDVPMPLGAPITGFASLMREAPERA